MRNKTERQNEVKGRNYLLPENLDLMGVVRNAPPKFNYSYAFLVYLINLIWDIPARNDKVDVKFGYVPFHSTLLQKVKHEYKKHLKYLIEMELLDLRQGDSQGSTLMHYAAQVGALFKGSFFFLRTREYIFSWR